MDKYNHLFTFRQTQMYNASLLAGIHEKLKRL